MARVFVTDTTVSVASILLITPVTTESKFDGTFLIMVIPPYLNWLKNKGHHFRNIYLLETILFLTWSLTAFQVFIRVHFIGYNTWYYQCILPFERTLPYFYNLIFTCWGVLACTGLSGSSVELDDPRQPVSGECKF